jgi:endonuclease III
MSNRNIEKVERSLLDLYQAGIPFLEEYPWEFEHDRWAEMLICLLIGIGVEANSARSIVSTLTELEVMSVAGLAQANQEQQTFIRRVLVQSRVDDRTADKAVALFKSVAAAINKRWNGHLQRLLREYGQTMTNDLATLLAENGVERRIAQKVATLWLQNVANIPIVLPDDSHIQGFCRHSRISQGQLLETADRLGLNVTVLDDLLALQAQSNGNLRNRSHNSVTPKRKRTTSTA